MTITPANATPTPSQTRPTTDSPNSRVITTIHAACRQTSAVADATEVIRSAVVQVAKCAASVAPASRQRPSWRRVSEVSSCRTRNANGATASAPSPLRQNAIASAGTAVAPAMIGPDIETPTTPIAIRATVRADTGPAGAAASVVGTPAGAAGVGGRSVTLPSKPRV